MMASGAIRQGNNALSVGTTSRSEPIVVRGVHYFDTEGNLVHRIIDEPHRLGPMATADFFIDAADVRGGMGANFFVARAGDAGVSEPVIAAVMIGSIDTKGTSFISRGTRGARRRGPPPELPTERLPRQPAGRLPWRKLRLMNEGRPGTVCRLAHR
jgi:hypothetical protein